MDRRAMFPVLLVCVFVLFSGCGVASQNVRPDFKSSDTFVIGVLQTKTVGEPMVEKMALYYFPGFVAQTDYMPPGYFGFQLPVVRSGSEWSCPRKYEDGSYRCNTKVWGSVSMLSKSESAAGWNLVITPDGRARGHVHDPWDTGTSYSDEQPVVFKTAEIAQPNSFKQELIYNGKTKDAIRISYREFKDSFARPAFSQDLSYDMTESKEIGFRGMIIEVQEATNSHIKFVVRKPMNQ